MTEPSRHPLRVVIVGRVSTDEQTPDNQLLPLRDAGSRLGWLVVEEVVIHGVSAWSEKEAAEVRRRVFAPFEQGRADLLATWSLDRLTRGGIESAFNFLRHLELDLGVAFWSLREPFLNTSTDPQQRELMIAMLSWVAKWESQRKSDRLKARSAQKRAHAGSIGERARWGRGKMPNEFDIAQVRKRRAEGWTMKRIASEVGFAPSTVCRVLRSIGPIRTESASPEPGTP